MPYFPGVARGVLHKGLAGANANSIVLMSVSGIKSFSLCPAGFLIVEGAPFSHSMITLLGYGVPVVIISEQQASNLVEGTTLLLNGYTGRISKDDGSQDFPKQPLLRLPAGEPVITGDGVAVNLCASVRGIESTQLAIEMGAQSIGLVRTEFLMPEDNSVPGLAYYRDVFDAICKTAAALPVTFRLLDLAEDKMPGWMPVAGRTGGALGLQGVRLYTSEPVRSVVEAQLSAINALPEQYNIRVLIPYLTRYEEFKYWHHQIRERLSRTLEIGAMAETPTSVLDIENWFEDADFIAIGCNDLMQCLFAADRDRPELRSYLDPYAPNLFRLFRDTAERLDEKLGMVQLCGVLSQLPGILPVLLGLGYRTFSVDAHIIPYLAKSVTETTLADAQRVAKGVCATKESREVLEILNLPINRPVSFFTH